MPNCLSKGPFNAKSRDNLKWQQEQSLPFDNNALTYRYAISLQNGFFRDDSCRLLLEILFHKLCTVSRRNLHAFSGDQADFACGVSCGKFDIPCPEKEVKRLKAHLDERFGVLH